MNRMFKPALACLCLAGMLSQAYADASFEMSQTQGGVGSYQVSNGMVRIRAAGPQGRNAVMLFDTGTGSLTQINDQQKVYAVMDAQSMQQQRQRMQDQMRQMMPQMEQQMRQQLQSMPAEQRQMVEKRMAAMKRSLSGQAPKRLEARDTGRTERVKGIACRVYEVRDGDQPMGSACVARAADLGISKADFDAVMAFFATMKEMSSAFAAQMPPELPGIPIRQSGPDGQTASELLSLSTDRLAPELFKAPAGYRKVDPTQGPPGAR